MVCELYLNKDVILKITYANSDSLAMLQSVSSKVITQYIKHPGG